MPTSADLDEYYRSFYWEEREKKGQIEKRDLAHWIMLKNKLPKLELETFTFLNFGAGHGGVSFLAWLEGHNIINVEPSGLKIDLKLRWKTVKTISEVPNHSADVVYGSHSLEHVSSIGEFESELKSKLKDNAHLFWEVPNGRAKECGPQLDRIDVPHTYYFTTDFFRSRYSTILLNDTFDHVEDSSLTSWWKDAPTNGEGCVIRFLGRF